jgi:hypothetical protein
MSHWRLTPEQIREIPEDHLAMMEFAYLVTESRQAESLNNLIGLNLGSLWYVDSLLRSKEDGDVEVEEFTWSKRKEELKINLPVTVMLTKDKNFMANLKKEARKLSHLRSDKGGISSSMLNLPQGNFLAGCDVVDLSRASKNDFLKFAPKIKV